VDAATAVADLCSVVEEDVEAANVLHDFSPLAKTIPHRSGFLFVQSGIWDIESGILSYTRF